MYVCSDSLSCYFLCTCLHLSDDGELIQVHAAATNRYPATDGELPADFVADMKTVLANARAFIQHSGHIKKEEKGLLDGVTAMTKALTAIEKAAKKQAAAAAAANADEEEELAEEPTPTKSAAKQRGPRTPAQQEEDRWADARADLESKLHQAKKDAKKQEKEVRQMILLPVRRVSSFMGLRTWGVLSLSPIQ